MPSRSLSDETYVIDLCDDVLGTVALREVLRLPATVTPLCAIAIGRPTEDPAAVERFRPERIHAEQW